MVGYVGERLMRAREANGVLREEAGARLAASGVWRNDASAQPLLLVWPGRRGSPGEVPAFLHSLLDNLIGL
ncbi:hypothetical protein SBA2_280011 [Acidobacteriia bacterium SbA2]|nr:hypothetical protein SBA2_280011 [Acidobacteriia bacterium SbA2]